MPGNSHEHITYEYGRFPVFRFTVCGKARATGRQGSRNKAQGTRRKEQGTRCKQLTIAADPRAGGVGLVGFEVQRCRETSQCSSRSRSTRDAAMFSSARRAGVAQFSERDFFIAQVVGGEALGCVNVPPGSSADVRARTCSIDIPSPSLRRICPTVMRVPRTTGLPPHDVGVAVDFESVWPCPRLLEPHLLYRLPLTGNSCGVQVKWRIHARLAGSAHQLYDDAF